MECSTVDNVVSNQPVVADDRRKYTCEICSSKFAFRNSLNKHLKRKHEEDAARFIRSSANVSDNQRYECECCVTKFSHKSSLCRHLKRKHFYQSLKPELKSAAYICEICLSKFAFRSSLNKHLKNKHDVNAARSSTNVSEKQRYQCEYCITKFSHKSSLCRHLKRRHSHQSLKPELKSTDGISKSVNCHICNKTYTTKDALKKHLRKKHNLSSNNASLNRNAYSCCICQFSCSKLNELVTHYLDHEINIKIENHIFQNYEKFLFWKENEEKSSYIKYTKKSGTRTELNGCKRDFFYCHRSGIYKSNSKGLRRLKIQGSRKIGKSCPSRMLVKTTQYGKVFVKYVITHVGHDMDLSHLNLSTTERQTLATKIASRVPFENILGDVRNSVSNERGIRRLHLITRQDLRNIKKCFNLTAYRDDATSVDPWAKESEATECTENTSKDDQLEIDAYEQLDESNIFLKHVEQSQSDMSLVDDISVNNFQQAKQKFLQDLANLTEYIEENINTPEELSLLKKLTEPIIPSIEAVKQKHILLPQQSSEPTPTESEFESISFQVIADSNPNSIFLD